MSKYKILFLVIFIFVFTRAAFLLTSIDGQFNSEDLAIGTLAKEVIKGPDLPLFEYQYLTYSGGTLIVGLLAVPFFFLFGPNYFALKLVPLLFSTLTLAVLFLFAWKFFNRRAAVIAAILYIFSSSTWSGYTIYLGFHTENLLFVVSALYVFYEIVFSGRRWLPYYLILGLICGFGVYFSYVFLVTLAVIFFIWFIHERVFFRGKNFLIFLAGFLLGFSPWIFYNLECNFRGLSDISLAFGGEKDFVGLLALPKLILNYLLSFKFDYLLGMEFFGEKLSVLYARFYYILWLGSILLIFWAPRKSVKNIAYAKEFFLLAYPAALLMSARFYGVDWVEARLLESRYLLGIFICLFLTLGIALDKIMNRLPYLKTMFSGLFFFLICFAFFGYARAIDGKKIGSGFSKPGYSYFYLAETFNGKYPDNLYKILDNITRLSIPEKYEALTLRLNFDIVDTADGPRDIKEYVKLSLRLPEKYRPYFYKILSAGLFYSSELNFADMVKELNISAKEISPKYMPYLYEGLVAVLVKQFPDDTLKFEENAGFVSQEYLSHYYRGLSAPIFCEEIRSYVERSESILEWIDSAHKPDYLDGVGEVLAKFGVTTFIAGLSYNNPGLVLLYDFIERLEVQDKKILLEGTGNALAYFYSGNTQEDIYNFMDGFNADERGIILKAMADNLRG